MLRKEAAKKLSVYILETEHYEGRPAYRALLELFKNKRLAGVTVFRGLAGYGRDGLLHTTHLLALSEDLPIKLEVVDGPEAIEGVLEDVYRIAAKGLIAISDTEVIRGDKD